MRILLAGLFLSLTTAFPIHQTPVETIERDVCIIGGGSTGTYSAIALRDKGKSIIVVEKKDRMGGHTETYTDPVTGAKADIGVVVFHDLDIVHQYFDRFGIPLVKLDPSQPPSLYVDLRTGKVVDGYTPADPSAAFQAYAQQLAKYPYLETGFNLSYPVPSDLLLPFRDFVQKYDLGPMVPVVFRIGQGLGDLLSLPTLYAMKIFGFDILKNIQSGFLTTERNDNSEIYEKAQAELGKDVFLNSHLVEVDRRSDPKYVKVWVETPKGLKLIKAKRIIVTIPPKLDNLDPFDLNHSERSLFSLFKNSHYYTGILRNSSIPDDTIITNIDPKNPYHIAHLPGVYYFGSTGIPGLQHVKYGSPVSMSVEQVQREIKRTVQRLKTAGTLNTTTPEFAVFSAHVPFGLRVSPSEIKNHFYQQLYGLQGQRRTYYTGAAFLTHDSSLLWQFTEGILAEVLESLH